MSIKVTSDREILREVAQILMEHMEPSKVARFWAACQLGEGDYTLQRRELFAAETVASLIEKVRAYEQRDS
jgi:hypothetical protein